MPTLEINGRRINVDDSFLKLTPEQQHATVDEIAAKLQGGAPGGDPAATIAAAQDVWNKTDPKPVEVAKQVLKGVPIAGAYVDEGAAALRAATGAGAQGENFGDRYAATLPREREASAAYERDNPWKSTGLQFAGGAASMAPLMAIPGAPAVMGASGPLVARIPAALASGASLSGLDAYLRGGDPVTSALVGGGISAAGPVVGKTVGAASNRVAEALTGVPGEIGELSRGARRALTVDTMPQDARRLAELGPEAFLFERNPASFQRAQAVTAARPGPAQSQMVDAVTKRDKGANARIRSDVEANFGTYEDPAFLREGLKQEMDTVGKQYGPATRNLQRLAPGKVEDIIRDLDETISHEAGASQKALREAKSYFYGPERIPQQGGTYTLAADKIKTDIYDLHRVRMALDDLYDKLSETPRAQGLVVNLRKKVDELMPPEVKRVDAKFEDLTKQETALDTGLGQVLRSGPEAITPEGLRRLETSGGHAGGPMSPGQADKLQAGVRGDIERIVGTQANDVGALRKAVGGDGDWNREKLAQIFGQAEADRVIGAVDREVAFKEAVNKLINNSQTAQRQRGAKDLDELLGHSDKPTPPIWDRIGSLPEMAWNYLSKEWGVHARGHAEEGLARKLTTQGAERDRVAAALADYKARLDNGKPFLPSQSTADRISALLALEAGDVVPRQIVRKPQQQPSR